MVAFKSNSPWLSNLRKIQIPRALTEKEFLILMQHTLIIEDITVDVDPNQCWDQPRFPFPKSSLPKLSSIYISTNLSVSARILDHIFPEKLSNLRLRIFDRTLRLEDSSILSSFTKNLPFYISSCFTSDQLMPSTAVLLSITNCTFRFYNIPAENIFDAQNFDIMIDTLFNNQLDQDNVVACLLDTFTLGYTLGGNLFNPITKLNLSLRDVRPAVIPRLCSMLSAFHHVQDIETNDSSAPTLLAISCVDGITQNASGLNAEQIQPVLFPELRTLHLSSIHFNNGGYYSSNLPDPILRASPGIHHIE